MTELKKRFTDTDKWSDPWFASLPKEGKLVWQFLCDRCDEAGFWTINLRDLTHFTEANRKDWDAFLAAAEANRVRVIGEKVWLVKFIGFQFPRGIHPKDPMRVAILRSLKQANAEDLLRGLEAPTKSLIMNLLSGAGQDPPGSLGEGAGAGAGDGLSLEGEGECRGGAGTVAERPSEAEVLAYADRIGLGAWKATDWLNEMRSVGWLDYAKRPVSDWRAMVLRVKVKWEADGRPSGPPAAKHAPNGKGQSIYEMKMQIEAKKTQMDLIKLECCNDVATGEQWKDPEAKKVFYKLKNDIFQLTSKIANQ